MEKKLPQPGQRYRCFKDRPCQIIALAADSKTGERMVVYQTLYDDFEIYVCPLSLFMSEADMPESTQDFIRKSTQEMIQSSAPESIQESSAEPLPDGISPKLMAFLDADTDEARYKILSEMADIVDDHMIDTMAVVLDMVIEDGPIDRRYQELKSCIRTRMRYEINRLR